MKKSFSFKILAVMLSFVMLSGFFRFTAPPVSAATAGTFSDIQLTLTSVRYDENLGEESVLSGKGATIGGDIFENYLAVPMNFTGTSDKRQNMIVAYDMRYNNLDEVARWDMEALGIPIRSTSAKDVIAGIKLTREYMFVAVYMPKPLSSPTTYNKTTGLYIYENPFVGTEIPSAPTRIMTTDPMISTLGCSLLNSHSRNFDIKSQNGVTMHLFADTLITFYDRHEISAGAGYISVTDLSGEYPETSYILEQNLLTYTDSSSVVHTAKKLQNVVFDGNLAYVLTTTDQTGKASDGNTYKTFGIFTLDFSTPNEPIVINFCSFLSDLYSGQSLDGSLATLNVTDGFAYVSTFFKNSTPNTAGIFKDKIFHMYTLSQNGSSFEYINEFAMNTTIYWQAGCNGIGAMQVIGDTMIALTSGVRTSYYYSYFKFNGDRSEILEYKKCGPLADSAKAACLTSLTHGSKMIFPLMQTGSGTDTNRAVIAVFDLLSEGIIWNLDNEIENKINESLYAYFNEPYIVSGLNKLYVTGENTTGDTLDVQILLALYKDEELINTVVGSKYRFAPNEAIDLDETIDLSNYSDLTGLSLKAYVWNGIDEAIPLTNVTAPPSVSFEFTLDENASVSAGVYDKDGVLIRTLWSAVDYTAGEHTAVWDGKDDFGNYMESGDYEIQVLSGNVVYSKATSVVGNSFKAENNAQVVSGYDNFFDMEFDKTTNRIYFCQKHIEGAYGLRYFNADDLTVLGGAWKNSTNKTAVQVASDGELIYWGSEENEAYFESGSDLNGNGYEDYRAFIHATDANGNSYNFTGDEDVYVPNVWVTNPSITSGGVFPYCINLRSKNFATEQNRISGLEVQQKGNFLFSSYKDFNEVYVNHKKTGNLLYTHKSNLPGGIAMQDDNTIWIGEVDEESGLYKVNKYTVNDDASFTYISSLNGTFNDILAIDISPSGNRIAIADNGQFDKLYVYDTTTGEMIVSYGCDESYLLDPTVKDDKLLYDSTSFWLKHPSGAEYIHSFIEFISDDEFFLGDSGNGRVFLFNLHENTLSIKDKLQYVSSFYAVAAVANEPERLWFSSSEYRVDYDKMETAFKSDGFLKHGWELTHNYRPYLAANFPTLVSNTAGTMRFPTTLENGYTYFILPLSGKLHLYKLKDNVFSDTGVDATGMDFHSDGSLWKREINGKTSFFYKSEIIDFDENNNPIYSEPAIVAEITLDTYAQNPYPSNPNYRTVTVTDSEKIITHDAKGPVRGTADPAFPYKKMSLGAIDISNGYGDSYVWMAAPKTRINIDCLFPDDGYYDMGNQVMYPSKAVFATGNHVMIPYNGEGYNRSQTSKILHFYENGLLIGVFGRTGKEYGATSPLGVYDTSANIYEPEPGNSASLSFAYLEDYPGVMYIYRNTENMGGAWISRVTGLDTIKVQKINVTYNNALVNGIAYTCFNDGGLDSAYAETNGISNSFKLPCISSGQGNHSIRYSCYYKPDETDIYRFAVSTDGIARLFVNGMNLLNSTGNKANYIQLKAGRTYHINVELHSNNNGQLSYFDVGYYKDGTYHPLDSDKLYCETPTPLDKTKINLLEGPAYGEKFTNGMFGWSYQIIGGTNASVSISRNIWTYQYDKDPDIYISNGIGKTGTSQNISNIGYIYTDRSLGEVNSDTWTLDMDIRFLGTPNYKTFMPMSSNYYPRGVVMEVLDKNNKVITNFHVNHNVNNNSLDVYTNETLLFSDPIDFLGIHSFRGSLGKFMNTPLTLPNNLKFEAENGNIRVSYCDEAVTVSPFPGSDISTPAKVRINTFNRYTSVSSGMTYNITRMYLYK